MTKMFTERTFASVHIPELSIPSSPTLTSPLSSTPHSRTSTITSNSCLRTALPSHRHMKIGKYFLERTIGKGNFAVVKLATHCETHQKVAIKIIDKSRLDPNDHKKLEREIAVMKSLVHPYIIRLYEVMESKNLIYLVTEYAANGELLDLLLQEKRLTEAKAKEKFRQLVLAVEYIHSKNIVHRDLKAENLLLDEHGNIKVADFGFANTFQPNTKLQTFCGSPPYAAPELFECLPYSPEKVDVWSLGVLLFVFVCGHLPFDSNNLPELRKRVLAGQFRLPFYISSDCSSLISRMLALNPEERYSINDIKNHSWLMLIQSPVTSQEQSIPNCQLTNAILDHAESLGYNRTQILKSVNGNSYDSDAAIWHLLLEKFQQTCQINNSHTPTTEDQPDLIYSTNELAPSGEPDIDIEELENYSDDDEDDRDEEKVSKQLHEQYVRTHGLRRHTVGRPALVVHNPVIPAWTPTGRLDHQSTSIEPALLSSRLHHLQQQQRQQQHQYDTMITTSENGNHQFYPGLQLAMSHQRNPHSTSYNGLPVYPNITAVSEAHNQQQRNNHWLSPPVFNHLHLNRRASDSGAHLFFSQHQYDLTNSNPIDPVSPAHIQSPLSNRSSRGSITRGAPISPPTFSITPHETTENEVEEDAETLTRYLNRGKRHTVCEQGLQLGGKARRATRESPKDRGPSSRRSSDTSSSFVNGSTKAYLERLYNSAVTSKLSDDDDVMTSSLQELHKLQKQVQKYPSNNNNNNNNIDSPIIRRASAVSSPTNSLALHIIREENQQIPLQSSTSQNKSSSSSSSSEALYDINDDEHEMNCEANHQYDIRQPQSRQFIRPPSYLFSRMPYYHHRTVGPYHYNTSPLLAQRLAISTTNSSYTP